MYQDKVWEAPLTAIPPSKVAPAGIPYIPVRICSCVSGFQRPGSDVLQVFPATRQGGLDVMAFWHAGPICCCGTHAIWESWVVGGSAEQGGIFGWVHPLRIVRVFCYDVAWTSSIFILSFSVHVKGCSPPSLFFVHAYMAPPRITALKTSWRIHLPPITGYHNRYCPS